MEKEYDVFATGNALMDLILDSDGTHIAVLKMHKGGIIFLDDENAKEIIPKILNENPAIIPGGAAANVISMLAHLGSKTFFSGKVGSDYLGTQYKSMLEKEGTKTSIAIDEVHTGTAITIITPDRERSFAVYLGSAPKISKDDIDFESIIKSKAVHIEGFQFYDKNLRSLMIEIAKTAKKNDCLISFDLSSFDLVKQYKEEVEHFIKEYVDILFANEIEAESYTGKNPDESVEIFSKLVDVAIVKIGEEGSLIKSKGEFYRVKSHPVDVIDTNGAGDAYAGAFLHAYIRGKSIIECGNLASYAASKVVSVKGARLQTSLKQEILSILN